MIFFTNNLFTSQLDETKHKMTLFENTKETPLDLIMFTKPKLEMQGLQNGIYLLSVEVLLWSAFIDISIRIIKRNQTWNDTFWNSLRHEQFYKAKIRIKNLRVGKWRYSEFVDV